MDGVTEVLLPLVVGCGIFVVFLPLLPQFYHNCAKKYAKDFELQLYAYSNATHPNKPLESAPRIKAQAEGRRLAWSAKYVIINNNA